MSLTRKRRFELYAVIDADRFGHADMLGMQIAVAFAHPPCLFPAVDQPVINSRKSFTYLLSPANPSALIGFAHKRFYLAEVFIPVAADMHEIAVPSS